MDIAGDAVASWASPPPRRHPPLLRWATFDPPLRRPGTAADARREVRCRVCGTHLGGADDPVAALLVAWRHRRHMARRTPG